MRIKFRLDLTNSRLDFFISKSSEMPYGITFWRIFGYSISDTTISHFFIEKKKIDLKLTIFYET